MKKILLFSLSLITLISCETNSIPVEGCTDPNAINYNPQADINNNSCDFTGDIIFYLDAAAGIYLYNEGVDKLTFYIDGNKKRTTVGNKNSVLYTTFQLAFNLIQCINCFPFILFSSGKGFSFFFKV